MIPKQTLIWWYDHRRLKQNKFCEGISMYNLITIKLKATYMKLWLCYNSIYLPTKGNESLLETFPCVFWSSEDLDSTSVLMYWKGVVLQMINP